ncbi:MAG: 3-deoxy-D-manno-octulosonic acid transferase [Syntrophobacteraceae bacterium]|nr:3-deoxy-D-manno-octulosonic acid transferase [Desulfobacteraceae bacterium]
MKDPGAQHFLRYGYSAAMTLGWPLFLLYYLLRTKTGGKYRTNWRRRMGFGLPQRTGPEGVVWFHALSVGETLSAIPLVKALKDLRPELKIVFSTATETGQVMARRNLGKDVDAFFFLPHDFPWIPGRLVKRLAPLLFIPVETDLWPNLLRGTRRRGVPAVLVNGRLSSRSFGRLFRFRSFVQGVYSCLDHIFAQSAEDGFRFEALGVSKECVHTAGNLKFDSALSRVGEEELAAMRESAGIRAGRAVWIGGSTHEGEEGILLGVHQELRNAHPDLLLILAPRHIERAAQVAVLAERIGLPAAMRSRGESAEGNAVYILDTLGELGRFYGLADAAFIGGSLVRFGGHNPLEAVAQGKPVLWGPHLSNFREMESSLLQGGCGRVVSSRQELKSALHEWLSDPGLREETARTALDFIGSHSGCSRRIAEFLARLLG